MTPLAAAEARIAVLARCVNDAVDHLRTLGREDLAQEIVARAKANDAGTRHAEEWRCPRCDSDRITMHHALGAWKQTCDRCGEEWGDSAGYHAASASIAAEEAAKPKPPAFRGPGPDIFLPGVNPWWFT